MLAQRVIELRDDMPDEWKTFLQGIPSPGLLADLIASNIAMTPRDRIRLLAEADPETRLGLVERHLEKEVTIAETQRTLAGEAGGETDPRRRERMLRQRMREIQKEIGETDAGAPRDRRAARAARRHRHLPEEAEALAQRELKRLSSLPQHAPDRHLIRTYLDWLLELPWNKQTEDHLDLAEARKILDADHHGLAQVKDRILEFLAVRKLAPDAQAPILCFVGPPGVGKTSLGRSIARCMGRQFTRASLGGVRDEAEIRGHRRTYVGSMPGRILQSLKRARLAQSRLPARRDRQGRLGFPRRSVVGAARGARSRAEPELLATTTSRRPSISRACSSSRRRTRSRRFRRRCSTAWR